MFLYCVTLFHTLMPIPTLVGKVGWVCDFIKALGKTDFPYLDPYLEFLVL